MWLLQTCQMATITLKEQRKERTIVTFNGDHRRWQVNPEKGVSIFEDDEIHTFHDIAFVGHAIVFAMIGMWLCQSSNWWDLSQMWHYACYNGVNILWNMNTFKKFIIPCENRAELWLFLKQLPECLAVYPASYTSVTEGHLTQGCVKLDGIKYCCEPIFCAYTRDFLTYDFLT